MPPRTEHHDEPTEVDRLAFQPIAKRIARRILDVPPPYVLGLHGEWGAGKSTLLRLVKEETIKATGRGTIVVEFQAWRHQHEAQPAVALLHTMRECFMADQRIIEAVTKGTQAAIFGSLRVFDEVAFGLLSGRAGGKGLVSTIREEYGRLETAEFAPLLTSEALPKAFEGAIATLLGAEGERLVVLIDDLDRCTDATVLRLLEGIKVYLAVPRTVFVVAADRDALVEAVFRELYRGDSGKSDDAQRRLRGRAAAYIEKFFQAVETVPAWPDLGPLVDDLWKGPERERLNALMRQHQFLPCNPRKVKRFLAELGARLDAMGPDAPDDHALALACAIQCVQTFHPEVYRDIERSPAQFKRLVEHVRARRPDSVASTPLEHLRFLGDPESDAKSDTLDIMHPDLFLAENLFKALGPVDDDQYRAVMRLGCA